MSAAVQIITTRMSGLTSCLTETVKACYDPNLEHRVIIMMPENLTLDAELEIIHHVTHNGLLGIRIVTPITIFSEITDRAGVPDKEPLTDFGRSVVISHILKQQKRQDNLKFYHNAVRQANLPLKLAEQIDEFRDGGFTCDSLIELSEHPEISNAMQMKYHDIGIIWASYLSEISMQFIDKRQQWDDLIARLRASHYFDNADFIVTGFSVLNQQLMRLMAAAAELATSTRLIVVADDTSPDARIFTSINNQLLSFGQFLFNHGIRSLRSTWQEPDGDQDAGIRFIERTLFAGGHRETPPDLSAVSVYTARSPFVECQYAAQTLIAWHNAGMAWREMAVAWNSSDILPDLLPMVLRDAHIPCTPVGGQSMLMNGYVQFVLSTVRAACLGYQQKDMLGMIKSGFCLEQDDAMDLENYAIEHGINRQKWMQPFPVPEASDPSYEFISRMEDCRQQLETLLAPLRKVLSDRKSTGRAQAAAIYQAMVDADAYQVLRSRETDYQARGMLLEIDRNRQVWDAVNDVLDQLAVYCETRHVALEELPVMLEAAFATVVVKSLPQTSDAVSLNTAGMFFSSSIRGMIIMGMQDRESGGESTLITDTERETLRKMTKIPFGTTRTEKSCIEMERISRTIAVARERLLISCSMTKPDGSMLYPSSVMRMITVMLRSCGLEGNIAGGIMNDGILPYSPSITLERISTRLRAALQGQDDILAGVGRDKPVHEVPDPFSDPDDGQVGNAVDALGDVYAREKPAHPAQAEEGIKLISAVQEPASSADQPDATLPSGGAADFADVNAIWRAALAYLYHDKKWHRQTARMLQGLSARIHVDDLTPAIAHRLYPETNLSISRLETFAACPYHHFLMYGLRPVIRQPFSFMANMRGDFYHAVMEGYIRKASALGSWPNLSEREMNGILDDVIAPLREQWRDGPLDVDPLQRFYAERIIRDIRHAAITITRNFTISEFRPTAYELRFGRQTSADIVLPPIQFSLNDATRITLNGQIDRLDTYRDENGLQYFRVVDYKSSQHVLRDLMLEEGLQLQIPIYMNAVQQAMPQAVPAGGLYQVIHNPLIDAEDDDEALIARKMGGELKLKGIVLDDAAILGAMGEVNGKSRSEDLVAAVPLDEIQGRMQRAMVTAKDLTERIFSGCIQIAPVQYNNSALSPCTYCPGATVCGIDARIPGGRPRLLKQPAPGEDEPEPEA